MRVRRVGWVIPKGQAPVPSSPKSGTGAPGPNVVAETTDENALVKSPLNPEPLVSLTSTSTSTS